MRKRNMIRWIFGIPAIVLILIGIILFCEPDRSGITRAAAAKSVALALLSPVELNAWEKTYGASRFAADEVGECMGKRIRRIPFPGRCHGGMVCSVSGLFI